MTRLPRFARRFAPRLSRAHSLCSPTHRRLTAVASLCGLMLALGGCDHFSSDEQRQADIVSSFYRIHLQNHAPGLPSTDELKQFEPLLSHALYALLTETAAADARYHAAQGSQAAPLIEGDLFTSLYEGATSFAVQSCDSDAQRASCQVALRYQKEGADESWNDKILLVKEGQQWRIDDIEFIGNDQSSQREYLSDTLADTIKEAQ